MIPKVIHYCWFGHNGMSENEMKCIDSWRKHCPGYRIVEWNERNFDVSVCQYVQEAYDKGKWAFVSDYARFKILYQNGGLYFDTDVELIRPIDDIVAAGPFMGCEHDANCDEGIMVNPGLGLGCEAGDKICYEVLESYEKDAFVFSNGSINYQTIVIRVTDILKRNGLLGVSGIQNISGMSVYPAEYFNPKDFFTGELSITENTRSIHHFNMSWVPESRKKEYAIYAAFARRGLNQAFFRNCSKLFAIILTGDFARIRQRIGKHE